MRAAAQGVTLLGALTIALLWTGLSIHQDSERAATEQAAVQNSDSLARAFEEHLSRTLREIDRSLKIARARYARVPDADSFRSWLRDIQLFDDQVVQVAVIGADGMHVLSTADSSSPQRLNLSDREHFRVHVGASSDDLFISKPVIGRVSGKWSIQLTRRIENVDGSFGGVIVASLDPSYLTRFYNSVDISNDGYISIVGTDGFIRAVSGHVAVPIGTDISGAQLFRHLSKEPAGWFYVANSYIDGRPRLVSYRTLTDYPLAVSIALSTSELFAGVDSERRWHNLIATAITLLILVVVGLSIRNRRQQQRAKIHLEQTRKFLDTIIENVPVPIVVKDAETFNFVLVNHAYESFIGKPRDTLIGRTVFDLFPQKDAELITRLDHEAIQFDERLIVGDFPVQNPAKGARLVNTTRLVVRGESDKPECLIVVIDDVTEKKQAEAKIAHMAHHDALTGLLNRARFNEQLEEELARVNRGQQLAVLLLDLDRFKQVNDTQGHLVGDELLKAVAERLRGCVREVDFVARLGGDEFAIIQTGVNRPADMSMLADRICAAITVPFDLGGLRAVVGVSIGISHAQGSGIVSAELLRQADVALYRAKDDGRGTYRFFKPELDATVAVRRELEADLRNAFARDEFELFYQPVVNVQDRTIVCLEALLRWHHPRRGTIAAAEFISVAEEIGLIVPLGEWVIRQACFDAINWPAEIKIAVNISPAQVRNQNLINTITSALASSGIAPTRLELEITEEMLFAHNRDNLAVLEQLRQLGVRIVMDDFGLGSSSLTNLRSFQFDKIKVHCTFAPEFSGANDLSLAIVQAVARLASALGVPAIAEGIETKEQLELIRAAGCTEFQGHAYSRPKPGAEIDGLFGPYAHEAVGVACASIAG